jgi:predicted RNA-binding Zn-ribbon protein involved in translation (DUF1610 family)
MLLVETTDEGTDREPEMTTIKATCPSCGEVGLTPGDIDLRVDETGEDDSFYAFKCPTCLNHIRKQADERIIRLLVSGGVAAQVIRKPSHPERRPAGNLPRLSADDLLDFHELLETPDWFSELAELVSEDRR